MEEIHHFVSPAEDSPGSSSYSRPRSADGYPAQADCPSVCLQSCGGGVCPHSGGDTRRARRGFHRHRSCPREGHRPAYGPRKLSLLHPSTVSSARHRPVEGQRTPSPSPPAIPPPLSGRCYLIVIPYCNYVYHYVLVILASDARARIINIMFFTRASRDHGS